MSSTPQTEIVQRVTQHVSSFWPTSQVTIRKWRKGPFAELGTDFVVLEVSPSRDSNNLWVYCSAGTGGENRTHLYEFVLVAPSADERHVETLTMLSHYHRFESPLGLGHIVNIGHSWVEDSQCDRLLLSLPYPFGPRLEWLKNEALTIQFLWALPITPEEAVFVKQHGIEKLEQRFNSARLHYWDTQRHTAV